MVVYQCRVVSRSDSRLKRCGRALAMYRYVLWSESVVKPPWWTCVEQYIYNDIYVASRITLTLMKHDRPGQ